MGCGLVQVRGVGMLSGFKDEKIFQEFKVKFIELLKDLRKVNIGGVIATLGQAYYETAHPRMLELGFTVATEYPNYCHGADGSYTQRLYVWKLPIEVEDIK